MIKYYTPKKDEFIPGFKYEEFIPEGTFQFGFIDFSKPHKEIEIFSKNPDEWIEREVPEFKIPSHYVYNGFEVTDYTSPHLLKQSYYSELETLIKNNHVRAKILRS